MGSQALTPDDELVGLFPPQSHYLTLLGLLLLAYPLAK